MKITSPIFLAPVYTTLPPAKKLGFYGVRPYTWSEWRSATFYTDRLIVSSK